MNRTETRVAIVGGGTRCHDFLTRIQNRPKDIGLTVVGVADPDPDAAGVVYARQIGIDFTPTDYHEFYFRDDIHAIVELTGVDEVRDEILNTIPRHIHFIDHFSSRFFFDLFSLADEHSALKTRRDQDVLTERNKLRDILDSLPYEILVISKDFVVEMANQTFLKANNLTLEAVVGKYCYDIDHKTKPPCGVSVDTCPHAQTLSAGHSMATVETKIDENGEERFISVRTAPFHNQAGEVLGVVEAIRDITPRIKTEEQLKDSRARLNQFIDTAPLLIYMKDLNLRYRVMNRHALEMLDLEEKDVVGHTNFSIFPEETAARLQKHEAKALKTGKTIRVNEVLPVKKKKLHVKATIFPVMRKDKPIGLFGLMEDRTALRERKKQLQKKDEQLSETQKLLEGVLENSRDIIFLTDPDGELISVNHGLEETLGYDRGEMAKHQVTDLFVHPEVQKELYRKAMENGHAEQYEVEFRHRHDAVVVCNVSLTVINDGEGEPIEVVGIGRNITTRLRLQADLERSERLAAIGKMAAGVAHEINNPLAIIKTIGGLIGDIMEDEGAKIDPANRDLLEKSVDRLNFQVKRASSITHSLLGFARKSEPGHKMVSITGLLDESIDLLAPEIHLTGCEIHREYSKNTPEVSTDPMLLQQVFVNLIKNAIDALEEKGTPPAIIELSAEPLADTVRVSIRDNGTGVPDEALGDIFDLFHTSKPAGKGTGLGLAIVHDIIKRLGCTIEVTSQMNEWTCFTLTIPVNPTDNHHQGEGSK
jgi:PAS domain S-box-containing protein